MTFFDDYKSGKYSKNTHAKHSRFKGGASIDDNLGSSDYMDTMISYISKRDKVKYLDKTFARKKGVSLIGGRGDSGDVFGTQRGRLFHTAKKSAIAKGGELLHDSFVKELINKNYRSKSGTEFNVFFVKKNIYIREITSRTGIKYTQARNSKTGRVLSIKKVLKIQ
jgi:hypothetical protein